MRICDHSSTELPGLHFDSPRLHCERPRHPTAAFWDSKLQSTVLNFDLNAYPVPPFALLEIGIKLPKIIRIRNPDDNVLNNTRAKVHRLTRVWTKNLGWVLRIDVEVLQQDGLGEGRPVVDPVHIKYWRIRCLSPHLNLNIWLVMNGDWFWILLFEMAKQLNSLSWKSTRMMKSPGMHRKTRHTMGRAFQRPSRIFFLYLMTFTYRNLQPKGKIPHLQWAQIWGFET
jgi:hypothetical protein